MNAFNVNRKLTATQNRPVRPVWLDDHICRVCGFDTGSHGHHTQCRAAA